MISSEKQAHWLEQAVDLIHSVLDGECSHRVQSVYLSVAADYCRRVAAVEKVKGDIDRYFDDYEPKQERRNDIMATKKTLPAGIETWQEIKALMAVAHTEGEKFYNNRNQAAGQRARKALDQIAKLKVQWRKEVLAA